MKVEIDFIIWLQSFASPFLDIIAKISSYLFDYPMMILLAVLLFVFYDRKQGVYYAIVALFSTIFQFVLKCLIDRPRPYLVSDKIRNIYQAIGSSFPSGHSVTAMGVALFVGLVIYKSRLKKGTKSITFVGLVVYLFLNLLNRTYLGQHYLTDIFAGYAIMIIIFVVAMWLYPYFSRLYDRVLAKQKKEEINGK